MGAFAWALDFAAVGLPSLVIAAHLAAEIFVIVTHTPAPGSTWARVYHLLDVLAGQIGKAKETGQLPAAPGRIDEFERKAEVLLAEVEKGNSPRK